MALDGKARLLQKKEELTDELKFLEEEDAANRDEKGNLKKRPTQVEREAESNQEYYESMRRKLKDYMGYLERRNEAQRRLML